MANNCYYQMKVVADSKEILERLEKIMDYEDPQYYIRRVRCVDMQDVDKEDGLWTATYSGDVAWAAHSWVDDVPSKEPDEDGRFYTTLTALSKELGFSFEIFSEEAGCCFNEHFHVYRGEVLTNDCTDWFDCIIDTEEELEDTLKEMLEKGILPTKGDAEEVRKQGKELIEEGYTFTVQFGGYCWDFGNAEDIDCDVPLESYNQYFEVIA